MPGQRPKVVIVGAGFGGLDAAKTLRRTPADIVVVDRQNYHCFQPLLYQVATAALSPADVAWPIRYILRAQANATVLMEEVQKYPASTLHRSTSRRSRVIFVISNKTLPRKITQCQRTKTISSLCATKYSVKRRNDTNGFRFWLAIRVETRDAGVNYPSMHFIRA